MIYQAPLVDRLEMILARVIVGLDWTRAALRRGESLPLDEILNAAAWALEYPAHYVLDDLTLVEHDSRQAR